MKAYTEPILKLHKLKMPQTILAGSPNNGTVEETQKGFEEGGEIPTAKQSSLFLDDSDFDKE